MAPANVSADSTSAAWPLLESVTVCAALLEPKAWAVKVSAFLLSPTTGCGVAVPAPFNAIVAGLPVALCGTDKLPTRAPAAAGVKLINTAQLAPAARLAPETQLLAAANAKSEACAPPSAMVPSTSAALPVLLTVTVWFDETEPVTWLNVSELGVIDASGAGVGALPLSATLLVAGLALWLKLSAPVVVPAAVGLNASVTVQLVPAATDAPAAQLPPVMAKALLLLLNDVNDSAAVPVFDRLTVCAALVAPTAVDAKVTVAGAALAAGVGTAAPLPLSDTVEVPAPAL